MSQAPQSWEIYKQKAAETREIGTSTLSREQLMRELFKRDIMEVFPLEVFPLELHPYIKEITERMHVPRSFVGLMLMAAGSSAIGSAYQIRAHKQQVFANGWWCSVGETSSGKSLVMKAFFAPFRKYDMEHAKANLDDYKSRKEAAAMADEPTELDDYTEKTVIFSKGTFQAFLRKCLMNNPKGVIMWKEEISALFAEFNKKGNEELETFMLEAWPDSEMYKYDLVSAKRAMIIPRTYFNLVGTTQPKLVRKFFTEERESSGFPHRVLFALDKENKTLVPDIDYEPNEEAYARYADMIGLLYKGLPVDLFGFEAQKPRVAVCTRAATELQYRWKKAHANRIDSLKDGDAIDRNAYKGAFGKLGEYVLKFALILRCMEEACKAFPDVYNIEEVDEMTMGKALLVTDYFLWSHLEVSKLASTRSLPEEASIISTMVKNGKSSGVIAKHLTDIYGRGFSETSVKRKINKYRNMYPREFLK